MWNFVLFFSVFNFSNALFFSWLHLQKMLFHAALQDPLNQMFFLLSETCIPIHPLPKLRIAFSQSDGLSYVNACPQDPLFSKAVQYNENLRKVNVTINTFKKSEQWVGLQRKHAQIIVDEFMIASQFHEHNIKFPDEHYIPTVLATYQLASETSCSAGVTYTNWHWWKKPSHPKVNSVEYFL